MRKLSEMRWPSERENLEEAVRAREGMTVEDRLLHALELANWNCASGADAIAERDKEFGDRELVRWIAFQRGQRPSRS